MDYSRLVNVMSWFNCGGRTRGHTLEVTNCGHCYVPKEPASVLGRRAQIIPGWRFGVSDGIWAQDILAFVLVFGIRTYSGLFLSLCHRSCGI